METEKIYKDQLKALILENEAHKRVQEEHKMFIIGQITAIKENKAGSGQPKKNRLNY